MTRTSHQAQLADDLPRETTAMGAELARPPTTDAILHVTRASDGSEVKRCLLEGHSWIIGRGPDAHIQLEAHGVSRSHAELKRCPFGRWWIHDLSSTNGTLVNGRRVRSCILARGDHLEVAGFSLSLEVQEPDAPVRSDAGVQESHTMPTLFDGMEVIPPGPHHADVPVLHLDAMMALGRRLMRIDEANGRRQELCERMVTSFGAQGALVLRLYEGGRVRLLAGPCGGPGAARLPTKVSDRVMRSLWEQKRPVVARVSPLGASAKGVGKKTTMPSLISAPGVLACPLVETPKHIDALYVSLSETSTTEEWRSLVGLIASTFEQVEQVWHMRRQVRDSAFVEHELETARALQRRLMPLDAHFDGLELMMGYEPCLWVGGDYVDAVGLPGDKVLLVIADVCGKGMQGTLVTASLHTLVRATVEGGEELPLLVSRMNRYLCCILPESSFVTLAAVALDPRTGVLECINAGHLPILIARPDGDVRALQSACNPALGMIDGAAFVPEYSQLADDEVLLMYTDGLVELFDADRKPLGPERFREGVARTIGESGGDAVSALDKALRDMIGDHRRARLATDDAAFLIVRRTLPSNRYVVQRRQPQARR